MNIKRLYLLFKAHFKINTRFRISFFFSMIFPLIFIGIFGIAFQESDPANSTISIAIINQDEGIPDNALVFNSSLSRITDKALSKQFIEILSTVTYEDNKTKILHSNEYDLNEESKALEDIEKRKVKALVIIPKDFSLGVMAAMRHYLNLSGMDLRNYPDVDYYTNVTVKGDGSLLEFSIVNIVMTKLVEIYFKLGDANIIGGTIVIESALQTKGFTSFDFVVPGLVIYAIINNLSTVASVSLMDVKSNLIDRFRLSKMEVWEYPTAIILSQLAMSAIQIPVMFAAALLFGFPFTSKILLAYIFAMLVSLSMSGMGLLLAGLVNDANSIGGLATLVATPMAFLAGAFFPMPNPTLIKSGSILGEHELGAFDLLPPRSAITSLRLLLINDWSLADLSYEIALLSTLTLFYLVIGIYFYSRKHLRTK